MYSASEVVCDDYYGTDPTDITKWIDNDCRYGANCMDGNCYATNELGPSGGYCCGGSSPARENRCKSVIDPSASSSDGVACGANKECNCIAFNGVTNVNHGAASVGDTIRTCVPPVTEYPLDFATSYDRKFLVGSVTHLVVVAEDIDGGHDCEGDVESFYDATSIWFQNNAGEDCLITVTIS